MNRFDITAYAEATTSWGEDCYVGALTITPSEKGQWVKAEDMELLQLKLDTITADRDAEKAMKATARMQRDEQTKLARIRQEALDDICGRYKRGTLTILDILPHCGNL
jgi:hypothetical protein